MADTFTPNLNLTKPEVGSSRDAWGGKWNGNADTLDAYIKAMRDDLTAKISTSVPPGVIADFPTANIPIGWLKCNGAALSRTTYANLFAVVGTLYGAGDGSTTFNVPDLRALFRRGVDEGRGIDNGRAIVSVQSSQNLDHGHDTPDGGALIKLYGGGPSAGLSYSGQPGYYTTSLTRNGGSEARPWNIALYPIIKY